MRLSPRTGSAAHLAAFPVAVLAILAASCTSVDPTDQAMSVGISNDLAKAITLRQCMDDHCRRFGDVWHLDPGSMTKVGTSDRGVANPYQVVVGGRVKGCLPLVFRHRVRGAVVKASTATRCGR